MLDQKEIVKQNLNFILSHFNGQEYQFPRIIKTLKTKGQILVDNEDEIFRQFVESDFQDCKINGYPFYDKDGNNNSILSPSFIYIDLDLSLCDTCKYPKRKLDYILKETLNKMQKEIDGIPTVLWTGDGYHIYLPIRLGDPNDKERSFTGFVSRFDEFLPYVDNDLTTEFMRFASKHFTNNHIAIEHSPCINSCYVTVPGTINSKLNLNVELIQAWDGKEASIAAITSAFFNSIEQRKHI